MSDKKPVSPTVSALRAVLARSVAITKQLDLKQGSWWEYTGFDKYARALQAEYQILVGLRTDIRDLLAPIPDDLRGDTATKLGKLVETFGEVEAEMIKLEAVQVTNTTAARNKHKDLVTAQIKIAKPLKDQIRDAVKTAVEETTASNVDDALKKDQATVKDLKARMDAVLLLDLGGAVVTPPGKLNGAIRQCLDRVTNMKTPLTPSQHDSLSDFDRFETEYKNAAAKETARKQREKDLRDWAAALKAGMAEIDNWRTNAEIAEARTILHTLQPFTKNVQALDRAIKAFPTFDPGTPDPNGLKEAVGKVTLAGTPLVNPSHAAVTSRDTDINNAVAAITLVVTNKSPPGTEPYEKDLKTAVAKIPGLIEVVRARYRSANHGTPPQQQRRASRLKTLQGEVDKYTRIGGWLNVCGLSGTARTGPNGPVFMSIATNRINGYTTHISQFQANAMLPPDGLNSSLDDAMNALFGQTGPVTGPHITLEWADDFGSLDNARLYYHSGQFRPGAVPVDEQASFQAKMLAELNHAMSVFRQRIAEVLA
jgi:hypothetical protein